MKKPVRPFVVEIKSGRRRTNVTQNPVWGTTDFKAMLKVAAADAPHLFTPIDGPEIIGVKQEQSLEIATGAPATTEELSAATIAPTEKAERVPPSNAQQTVGRQQSEGAILRKKTPRNQRRAESGSSREDHPSQSSDQDDLFILEEENRRLKWLLANHLRQQNSQLRAMLERFRDG